MNKSKKIKKKFFVLLSFLLVVGMGIGYAVLSQQLNVNNTVSYDAMKWDVGFTSVSGVTLTDDAILPNTSISDDKKTLYIDCDFGTSTTSKECTSFAMISNLSSFNVELISDPVITFDSDLIKEVQINWFYSYDDVDMSEYPIDIEDQVVSGVVFGQNESREVIIRVVSEDLSIDTLPNSVVTIPISINIDWQQTEKEPKFYSSYYEIGSLITIENEKFNVIGSTPSTVTMLAQKSLGSNYRQSDNVSYVKFSNNKGWEYAPGPNDVDIQQFDGPVKTYLNEYGTYLKTVTGDNSLVSDLITVNQLRSLGCIVESTDYSPTDGDTCGSSPYLWLLDDTWWWTKSAWNFSNSWYPGNEGRTLWIVTDRNYFNGAGILYDGGYWWTAEDEMSWGVGYHEGDFEKTSQAVRPVITMSKDKILKYLN